MSKTVNKNGVRISQISSIHKAFTKSSGIPADEITRALAADWKAQRDEAMGYEFQFLASVIPLDLTTSGCWLAAKLKAERNADGTPMFSAEYIKELGTLHGRACVGHTRECWKIATKIYQGAVEEKKKAK